MKFVSISGPKNDLDRIVNQYLSRYEIQLENALTELKSASKLEPYPGTNPYREPLQKAQKLLASCAGAKQMAPNAGTMPVENAIALVNDMDTELAASTEEREALKSKEKEVSSLLEQVRLYVELDFDIPGADHRRAESLEDRDLRLQFARERLGQRNAAAHDHHVDVGRRPSQVVIAHIAADDESLHALLVGKARNPPEYGIRQRHASTSHVV